MTESAVSPVSSTFAILASSDAPRVGELLTAALNVPREPIQYAAAEAILTRQVAQTKLELFRRIEELPRSVQDLIRRSSTALEVTFRQLLLQGHAENRRAALKTIRITQQFHQIANLVELLRRPSLDELEEVLKTLRSLVDGLYDAWRGDEGACLDKSFPVDATRQMVLAHLERAVTNWDSLLHPTEVVESILILAEPQQSAVKTVLWNGPEACRQIAAELVLNSRHPGISRLAAESLMEHYPHPKVFEAIRTRRDPEFLAALLRVMTRRKAVQQMHHLRQLQKLDWLEPPYDLLGSIPPALQPALMAFVNATRIPREVKADVQEWLLRCGSPEGKRAATAGMTLIEETVIQEVVREGLDSNDAGIQAWATSQLRQHAIPEAFALLIDRLDSPLDSVQTAARAELTGFSVPRVLAIADDLPLEDARRAGQLLMKVDLDAGAKLQRELAHPARQKRIRTARQVARLGLQDRFLPAYLVMAQDSDPIARRTAADVLATIPHHDAYLMLVQLLDDPHPRVRESAEAALSRWETQDSINPVAEVLACADDDNAASEW